jgi:hypothetical protein
MSKDSDTVPESLDLNYDFDPTTGNFSGKKRDLSISKDSALIS